VEQPGRSITSLALVVLGAFILMSGWFVNWADQNLFDSEQIADAATAVVVDPEFTVFIVREVTDRVMSEIDTPQLRPQVEQIVSQVQRSEEFAVAFREAADRLHRDLVDGGSEELVFNLEPVAIRVRAALISTDPSLEDQLPPAREMLRFDIAQRSDIPWLWRMIDRFRSSGEALLVFGGCLIALGLAVGPGRWLRLGIAGGLITICGLGMITLVRSFARRMQYRSDDNITRVGIRRLADALIGDLSSQAAVIVLIGGIMVVAAGIGAVVTLDRR
jgi:hypothetical protein